MLSLFGHMVANIRLHLFEKPVDLEKVFFFWKRSTLKLYGNNNNQPTIHMSCHKFWIYWVAVNTKFITIQYLQHDTYKYKLYGKQKKNIIALLYV